MSDLVRSDGAVSARPLSRLEVGSISRRLHVARLTVGWERISFAAILLTAIAFQHLGYTVPQGFVGTQASLFEEPEGDE